MNAEKKRNIKIGVFAVVAFAILCIGLNYLKGRNIFTSGATLKAYYANVDGLTDSSPVMYKGFKVGSVTDVDIDQSATDPHKLFCVTLGLEKNIGVPVDSKAWIVSTDLLGGKGVEIVLGVSSDMAGSGDSIASGVKGGMLDELMPVKDDATALMRSADVVMRDIDSVLDVRNRAYLDEMIRRMSVAMENIETVSRNLAVMTAATGSASGALKSAEGLMTSLNGQTGRIDTIMASMARLSQELAGAGLGDAVTRLDTLIGTTQELLAADGNIAQMANDKRLYENIVAATENLNRLLVDVRLNPSRYVNVSAIKFGGKQVYFSDVNSAANVMRGRVAAVSLTKSKEPLDMPVEMGGKKVLEYCYDGRYRYIVVPFGTESEAQEFMREKGVTSQYKDAEVVVFVDGVMK